MRKIFFSIFITIFILSCFHLGAQIDSTEIFMNKGKGFYKSRSLDSALYYFDLALDKDSLCDEAYFRRGLIKEKQKNPEGAVEDYSIAISINPKPIYYNNLGVNLTLQGRHEKAIEEYDKALAMDSLYVQAIFNKGVAYHNLGKYDKACEYARKALDLGLQIANQYIEKYCK